VIHLAELLKVREITIDTMQYKDFATKEEELKLIRFYQNDLNSAKLLINVTHDKVVTDFSTATKVQIAFLKPDGKRVFQEVQNVNQMQGKYYVVLSTQTLIAYGNVIAQLRLTFPNNKVIETCKFVFAVDESIMSDEAMASTNEFPVIQKAIEAGEKLEGVDINGIIAAGALAAGALPKTGGTMTGSLNIANTKVIDFLTPTSKFTLGTSTSEASPDRLYLYDNKNGKTVLDYNANNGGMLTLIGETNLLKKTEIYKDSLQPSGRTLVLNQNTDLNTIKATGVYGGTNLVNAPVSNIYFYLEVYQYHDTKYTLQRATSLAGGGTFNQATWVRRLENDAWGAWERLIDSKGGTMTGNLEFDTSAAEKRIFVKQGAEHFGHLFNSKATGIYNWRMDKFAMSYNAETDTFNVEANNTNLLKTTGGGLTGDVTITGANKGLKVSNATEGLTQSVDSNGVYYWYATSAKTPLRYDIKSDILTVNANFKTAKDGRATLTLTADAISDDVNFPVRATRRGNTVTITGKVMLKPDATGNLITTLPEDMRPATRSSLHIPTSDGSTVFIDIQSTGTFTINTKGKAVYMTITYVVD